MPDKQSQIDPKNLADYLGVDILFEIDGEVNEGELFKLHSGYAYIMGKSVLYEVPICGGAKYFIAKK